MEDGLASCSRIDLGHEQKSGTFSLPSEGRSSWPGWSTQPHSGFVWYVTLYSNTWPIQFGRVAGPSIGGCLSTS